MKHASKWVVALVAFLFLAVGSVVGVKVLQHEQCDTLRRGRTDTTQILTQIVGLFPPNNAEVAHIQQLIEDREPIKC